MIVIIWGYKKSPKIINGFNNQKVISGVIGNINALEFKISKQDL